LKLYLNGQRNFEIASDQFFSPLYVKDLIKLIDIALKKNLIGLYNVCGDDISSRIGFIKKIFLKQKIYDAKLIEVSMKKFDNKIFYPLNTSMRNNKIKTATNFNFSKLKNLKFK